MAKSVSKSFLEGSLVEKTDEELKERALELFQNQRDLAESKKNDVTIQEHREYMKDTYSTPNSDIESEIKVLRRVFRLRGVKFNSSQDLEGAIQSLKELGASITITGGNE